MLNKKILASCELERFICGVLQQKRIISCWASLFLIDLSRLHDCKSEWVVSAQVRECHGSQYKSFLSIFSNNAYILTSREQIGKKRHLSKLSSNVLTVPANSWEGKVIEIIYKTISLYMEKYPNTSVLLVSILISIFSKKARTTAEICKQIGYYTQKKSSSVLRIVNRLREIGILHMIGDSENPGRTSWIIIPQISISDDESNFTD